MLKATADRTSLIRSIPRRLLAAALDFAIKRTASRPAPAGVMSPRGLVPTLRYDAQTVNGAAGALERFGMLSCEVLLLGGARSARNLTASLDGLSRVLPGASRVVIPGTGRTAPDNSRQPDRVAAVLHDFFGWHKRTRHPAKAEVPGAAARPPVFSARASPPTSPPFRSSNSPARLAVDSSNLQFFDPDSGLSIDHGAN